MWQKGNQGLLINANSTSGLSGAPGMYNVKAIITYVESILAEQL